MLTIAFIIILVHWIADFVLQTHWQATNKSTSNRALLSHTGIYSLAWILPAIILLGIVDGIIFVGITFILHTITDYFTSRLNSHLWKKGDIHNFFVSVGFDQILHYGQLFLTYWILKG
jgi:hypothetical protein